MLYEGCVLEVAALKSQFGNTRKAKSKQRKDGSGWAVTIKADVDISVSEKISFHRPSLSKVRQSVSNKSYLILSYLISLSLLYPAYV